MEQFSAEKFKSISWLNDRLSTKTASQDSQLKQQATDLLLELQVLSDDIADEIDQLSSDFSSNFPKLWQEMNSIQKDSAALKVSANQVRQVTTVAPSSSESEAFKQLMRSDLIMTRMHDTLTALNEAGKWSSLQSDMETVLRDNNFEAAATRLADARASLALLETSPDYKEKKSTLLKFQERLESVIRPMLSLALEKQTTDQVKSLLAVYDKIEKLEEFYRAFCIIRKANFESAWKGVELAFVETDIPRHSRQEFQVRAFRRFFEEAYLTINQEHSWLCQFDSSNLARHTAELIKEAFKTIEVSFGRRLKQMQDENQADFVPLLIEIYHSAQMFAFWIERKFSEEWNVTKSVVLDADKLGNSQSADQSLEWCESLFAPFTKFQQSFREIERQFLRSKFTKYSEVEFSRIGLNESSRLIREAVTKLQSLANDATEHCRRLTRGFGVFELIGTLDQFYGEVFASFNRIITARQTAIRAELSKKSSTRSQLQSNSDDDALDMVELQDEESVLTNDWTKFMACLQILVTFYSIDRHLTNTSGMLARELEKYQTQLLDTSKELSSVRRSSVSTDEDEPDEETAIRCRGAISALKHLRKHFSNPISYQKQFDAKNTDVLRESRREFETLYRKIQELLGDSLIFPLTLQFASVSSMSVWHSSRNLGQANVSFAGLEAVGEALLMMPRLFDSEFQSTGTSLTNNDTIATSSDEIESALDFMSAGLIIDTCGEENDAGALNKWVQYVVLKITRYYLFEQLLQIPAGSITTFGAQQLLTDLDYFCNILSALGMSIDDSRASMAAELKALKIIQKVIECMASPPKGPDLLKSVWNRLSSDKKMDSAETTAPATEEIIRLLDNDDAGRRVFIQTLRLFRDQFI